MKNIKLIAFLLLSCLFTVSCSENEFLTPVADVDASSNEILARGTGNDAPSGAHYNLNIIGTKDKTADMTGSNGHVIFVPLDRKVKIMLIEGDDFAVLDANGTDRDGASFQLPNPDPDGDGMTSYSIYMRALGKPGGKAVITTCADADLTDAVYEVCSSESLEVESTRGPKKFQNVTRTLLTILVDDTFTFTDGDGNEVEVKAGRYTIFDPIFEDYFWSYDNNGLRLLQLRFYPEASDIS